MYRFCKGDKQGYNVGRPCRPRPREPAFQYSAYCVICASLLPRPPYEVSHCGGSSEEDAEYVDSVEIAEYAVRRLPFLKPKPQQPSVPKGGAEQGTGAEAKRAVLRHAFGDGRAGGNDRGGRGGGGRSNGYRGNKLQKPDRRQNEGRNGANGLRRRLSGSLTLYGLHGGMQLHGLQLHRANSRQEEPAAEQPQQAVCRGPARCRGYTHTPTSLSTSVVAPPPPPPREMISVSLGLRLGRLSPFAISKTGTAPKPQPAARTTGGWRRESNISIASTASTTSTASIATTISTDTTTTRRSSMADGTSTKIRKDKTGPGTGTVGAWPSWTVLAALRVFRPAKAPKPTRERIHL